VTKKSNHTGVFCHLCLLRKFEKMKKKWKRSDPKRGTKGRRETLSKKPQNKLDDNNRKEKAT